jgi:hypothetical protein
MLQKFDSHISECLDRATGCRRRAEQADQVVLKFELLDLERTWTHLAQSYEFVESLERFEFVESLERFVLSAHDAQNRERSMIELTNELKCPDCKVPMRLLGIEAHPAFDRTDLQTYVCPHCDGLQTQAVPAEGPPKRRSAMQTPATLRPQTTFDAETTRLLGATFDAAWGAVLASGDPLADANHVASLRETLAKRIIEMVRQGERNPHRLAEGALQPLGLSRSAKIELSS